MPTGWDASELHVMGELGRMDRRQHDLETRIEALAETVTVLRTQIGLFGIIVPVAISLVMGVIKDALVSKAQPVPAIGGKQ